MIQADFFSHRQFVYATTTVERKFNDNHLNRQIRLILTDMLRIFRYG